MVCGGPCGSFLFVGPVARGDLEAPWPFYDGAHVSVTLEFPLHSPDFYAGNPYPAYQRLRAEDPVHWHAERGFWAILKYRDRHMARTAVSDVEIRGKRIRAGDVVVLLYGSANRDEEVFGPDAESFHTTRSPNPHIAFGFGEHLCLGASLARGGMNESQV